MSIDAVMRRAAECFAAGDLAEARRLGESILREQPRHFYAMHLLGAVAARAGEWEPALAWTSRALELDPGHVEVRSNRAAALRNCGRYSEAADEYARLLERAPGAAAAWNGRGVALAALGRHSEALAAFDAALRLDPALAPARFNRALSRLTLRDFEGGWDDYEARWEGSDWPSPRRSFSVPALTAVDPAHRVALWTEQGIGDQVLFTSLIDALDRAGMAFVLEADPRLIRPLSRARPSWTLVPAPAPATAFAGCDRHLPLGSLPRLLRLDRRGPPSQPSALLAGDPARTAQYRSRLGGGRERVIGISWRSFQPRQRGDYQRRKSAPLAAFRDFSTHPGVRLLDLQYGDTREERAAFAAMGGRLDRLEELDAFGDLDGLLAAIGACDAVVTVSNVTAHLSGASGKRTLLLYPGANPAFHYWVPDSHGRSPWHPSVEIVTGEALIAWNALVAEAARRLG